MADPWQLLASGNPLARIQGAYTATPADGSDLPTASRSIYVNDASAGTLKVTFVDGTEYTYPNLQPGRHPIGVKRIWSTGTSLTSITVEY